MTCVRMWNWPKRGGVLDAESVLAVKRTLVAARSLLRTLDHQEEEYPILKEIAVTAQSSGWPGRFDQQVSG